MAEPDSTMNQSDTTGMGTGGAGTTGSGRSGADTTTATGTSGSRNQRDSIR